MKEDEDALFVEALRADLPSADQAARLRRRLLAAGITASTVTLSATSSAQLGPGASILSKLVAASWPLKLGLALLIAAPVVTLPLWLEQRTNPLPQAQPAPRTSAAGARAASVASAAPTALIPTAQLGSLAPKRVTPRVAVNNGSDNEQPAPVTRTEGAIPKSDAPRPAQAAFDSVTEGTPSGEPSRVAPASTLAAETGLLDRAFAELAAGHRAAAAALIAEHERRFPNGLLRQERERARARLNQRSENE